MLTTMLLALALTDRPMMPVQEMTGNDVYQVCRRTDQVNRCDIAWLRILSDPAITKDQVERVFCYPEGSTQDQWQDVAVTYLRDHPATRHKPILELTRQAMTETFPCNQ